MKKFKYKVEAYLKFTKHKRDQALKVLHEAGSVVKRIEDDMKKVDDKIKKAYSKNSEVGKEISDINYINDNNLYLISLKKKMSNLSEDLKIAEDVYKDKYEKLMALQQKLKSIEIHKEKSLKDYKKDYNKHQQKLFDEMNSARRGGKNAKPV